MKIRSIPIEQVLPYERNPRKNEAAVEKVAESIREFGFRQPIVVDPDFVVIAGHTRLLAAKRLELKRVPVHIAEGLSEAQIRAYRLADNRTAEEAEWDQELLAIELGELGDDIDLSLRTSWRGSLPAVRKAGARPRTARLSRPKPQWRRWAKPGCSGATGFAVEAPRMPRTWRLCLPARSRTSW